jgi:hypothetical protein
MDGLDGRDGFTGPKGDTGATGPIGEQGLDGLDGEQGLDGEEGSTGPTGARGEDGSEIKCLRIDLSGFTNKETEFSIGQLYLDINNGALFEWDGQSSRYINPPKPEYIYFDNDNCYLYNIEGLESDLIGNIVFGPTRDSCIGEEGDRCLLLNVGTLYELVSGNWEYIDPPQGIYKFVDKTSGELYSITGPISDYIGIVSLDKNLLVSANDGDYCIEINDETTLGLFQYDGGNNQWIGIPNASNPYIYIDEVTGIVYNVTGTGIIRNYTILNRTVEVCPRIIEQICCSPKDLIIDQGECNIYQTNDGCTWKLKCNLNKKSEICDTDGNTYIKTETTNEDTVNVNADNGFIIEGSNGALPDLGSGQRLIYHGSKGSLRSGCVDDNQWNEVNIGDNSTALGKNTIAKGNSSFASGISKRSGDILEASGEGSSVLGYVDSETGNTTGTIQASNFGSHSSGYCRKGSILSSGQGSFAHGYTFNDNDITNASGVGSISLGQSVKNNNNNSMILGQFGTAKVSSGVINGTSSLQIAGGADNNSTDSISVILGTQTFSNTTPIGGGIADFWAVSGADYAEYFEWEDGNTNDESRVALFVQLEKDKIKVASDTNNVIGITTAKDQLSSGFIGDAHELHWKDANLKDEYGQTIIKVSYAQPLEELMIAHGVILTEDIKFFLFTQTDNDEFKNKIDDLDPSYIQSVNDDFDFDKFKEDVKSVEPIKVAITNEQYNPNLEYIPRSQRKEWIPVGLMGKIYVRDNGQCIEGEKCDCLNGIAIPGSKWNVLSRKNDNVIRILFK